MKRLLATLSVYVDKDSTRTCESGRTGPTSYVLDMNRGEGKMEIKTAKQFQTVMAHELGHFVALVTHDPTHASETKVWQMLTGDASSVIPAERKAWAIAHDIMPDLDREEERKALETYTRNSRWGNIDAFGAWMAEWKERLDYRGDYPAESDVLPHWLAILYALAIPVLVWLGFQFGGWQLAKLTYYRIRRDRVHKCIKASLHMVLFVTMIAVCVLLSEMLHHWRAVTIASVSAASYAVKGIEVLTDVIADRLFPSMS